MTKCRGSSGSGVSATDWRTRESGQFELDDVCRSDEEEEGGIDVIPAAPARRASSSNTSYPGVMDVDPIRWSRRDELRDANSPLLVRWLLFLGYSMGVQIWDCTRWFGLGTRYVRGRFVSSVAVQGRPNWVAEAAHWGGVSVFFFFIYAKLTFANSTRNRDDSPFLIYSLRTHLVTKSLLISGFPNLLHLTTDSSPLYVSTRLFRIDIFADVC
jgi:hypothetical protein